ncbi:hypothetical protein LFT44_08750 [Arthrobacter sp. FW306-05-C]|uniref:hypothetical protein n=1 Tax=Arthrobacter sp. FW306-05-C TaxID=2879620 RepID=UPI001F398566|nr:hypothetical protein [Arthrobacter sp. FW306-05-C]UKA68453.1 hypothetical protein LFT44_08750 [Arthrobacter sp. FW306-05-C]
MRPKPGPVIFGKHDARYSGSGPLSAGRTCAAFLLACLVLVGGAAAAAPASADMADASSEGYLLVQQALGHLVHDPAEVGPVLEKIDAALAAPDQEGLSVSELQQAKDALQAGSTAQGRALLQESITVALSTLKPATGDQTGTTVVLDPLPPRGPLTGSDWGFLTVSMLAVLTGLVLAFVFRPQENVRELRLLLVWKHRRQSLPPKHERSRRKER